MATATKQKRPTASSVVRRFLDMKKPPSNEKIIAEVRAKSGSKKFDGKHLSWYRSRHKKGELGNARGAAAN